MIGSNRETTYGYNGTNDKRVVVSEDDVVGAPETDPELGSTVLLCMLQCATCE
jgi:hypothetical protein